MGCHVGRFLDVLFHSDTDTNYGQYANAEVDALLGEAGVAQDTGLSLALYQQTEQKLIDDAACLPLWFGQNYILVKPYVKGYSLSFLGIPVLNRVSVEPH